MIKPTPAPKARYPQWLAAPYTYAGMLAVLAVAELMGLGGFDFANIAYETPGEPGLIVVIAALQIFSIPFLLRLPLSPLARFFSATFAFVTPFFIAANIGYLMSQGVFAIHSLTIAAATLLVLLGTFSFVVLDGPKALRLVKK